MYTPTAKGYFSGCGGLKGKSLHEGYNYLVLSCMQSLIPAQMLKFSLLVWYSNNTCKSSKKCSVNNSLMMFTSTPSTNSSRDAD